MGSTRWMMAKMVNTLDVTLSGYPESTIQLPNGDWTYLISVNGCECYRRQFEKPKTMTLHLVNIESFETLEYPLIEYSVKEKPISWFKKFWYDGWNYDKIYDINIKQIGLKVLTKVYMRSKQSFIIDESAECLKNALDACVWNADIKE